MKKMLSVFAVACSALAFSHVAQASEKVYVYNWSEYLPDQVLDMFTEETGIEVIYSTYDSNETMYAKLKLVDDAGYDVAVPSSYYVSKMAKEGMLAPIDHSKLTNYAGLEPTLLDQEYDPKNTYSVPYMWGSTGIGVDASVIDPSQITSWKDLWNEEYRGQLLLQDDVREVFHMALMIKGYNTNTRDPKEIEDAYLLLKELMPNVLLFNSDSPRLPFLAGEVGLGMLWNGEAFMGHMENPDLTYIYPKEGANFWVDSFVIPKNSKNIENAHKFIDFILRPDIAKICVEENGYSTPVAASKALFDEKIQNNKMIFPDPADIERGQFTNDVGDALPIYQKYWQLLRSSN